MQCLQCQSADLVKDVRVVDRGDSDYKNDLVLEVYANPDAWIFKGAKTGALRANVCVDCGFVMMHVSKATARTLKKHKKR